jgi:hypothetical protein
MKPVAERVRLLRTKAERCYRLARFTTDPEVAAELNALGRHTDTEIADLEAHFALRRSRILKRRQKPKPKPAG